MGPNPRKCNESRTLIIYAPFLLVSSKSQDKKKRPTKGYHCCCFASESESSSLTLPFMVRKHEKEKWVSLKQKPFKEKKSDANRMLIDDERWSHRKIQSDLKSKVDLFALFVCPSIMSKWKTRARLQLKKFEYMIVKKRKNRKILDMIIRQGRVRKKSLRGDWGGWIILGYRDVIVECDERYQPALGCIGEVVTGNEFAVVSDQAGLFVGYGGVLWW